MSVSRPTSSRTQDKGVSVRRRVIKLLKSIFHSLGEEHIDMKVDICQRLMSRMYDEDSAMKVRYPSDGLLSMRLTMYHSMWFISTGAGHGCIGRVVVRSDIQCLQCPSD